MTIAQYTGSCQCGAIAFQAHLDLDITVTCNCSRCQRLGAVWAFTPESGFRLTQDGPVAVYTFNTGKIAHAFCPTGGIEAYSRSDSPNGPMVAINCNALAGVNPRTLNAQAYDGAAL